MLYNIAQPVYYSIILYSVVIIFHGQCGISFVTLTWNIVGPLDARMTTIWVEVSAIQQTASLGCTDLFGSPSLSAIKI